MTTTAVDIRIQGGKMGGKEEFQGADFAGGGNRKEEVGNGAEFVCSMKGNLCL
jgi:hypothetical protein